MSLACWRYLQIDWILVCRLGSEMPMWCVLLEQIYFVIIMIVVSLSVSNKYYKIHVWNLFVYLNSIEGSLSLMIFVDPFCRFLLQAILMTCISAPVCLKSYSFSYVYENWQTIAWWIDSSYSHHYLFFPSCLLFLTEIC